MRFRNLKRYRTGGTAGRMNLSIPPPTTPDGRVYRYSPNERAHPRHFVLGDTAENFTISDSARGRMKLEPGSDQTVCPYSGVIASDEDFTHPDDVKAAVKMVEHGAMADVEAELGKIFEGINRKQSRNSLVQIKATVKRKHRPKPRFGRRDLLRELVCDHCGRDYGVYAIGLFCPDCGAPNLRLHFAREIALVQMQVDLAESRGAEHQELAYRLLGNAHEDVLTAFEATLKTVYLYRVSLQAPDAPSPKPVKNDFQNVERAQKRFAAFDFDPFAALDRKGLQQLALNIQKRHVIGHNLGVVDASFARHAADARLGETVHLVGDDIRRFAELAQQVVDRLDAWLSDGAPPPEPVIAPPDEEDVETQRTETPVDNAGLAGLGPLARRLGCWLSEQSADGLTDPVPGSAVLAAFPDAADKDLERAIAELDADGFVMVTPVMNARLPRFRPTLDLYVTFDPLVSQASPQADAATLIDMILPMEDTIDVRALHKRTGWPLRRFNPALQLVIDHVDDRRVGNAGDGSYPARYFVLMPPDRVALERFAARLAE